MCIDKMYKFKRILQYPIGDIQHLVLFSLLLLLADFQIRFSSSRKILHSLTNRVPNHTHPTLPRKNLQLEKIIRLLETADRHVPGGPSCLRRVIVLIWLLKWLGQAAALKVGVRRVDNSFLAHAWLELNDQILETSPGKPVFETLLAVPAKS